MYIYQKLAEIQGALMKMKLPKSGKNHFGGFDYYELEDILPPIYQECYKRELTLIFTFIDDYAILKIKAWDKSGSEISVRVPFPEIREMNSKMNLLQSEGSYITYLKRYLLINTFLIMEKDVVDNDANVKMEVSEPSGVQGNTKQYEEVPEVLQPILDKMKEQGKIITRKTIAQNLNGVKYKDKKERATVLNYLKKLDEGKVKA